MAQRTPIPIVRKHLDRMRLELLNEKQSAKPIIAKLAELFGICGDGPVEFSRRLELRQEIRELLVQLDCSGDLDGE